MSKGHLTQNKVHLKDHEYETVKFLLDEGFDIILIPASQIKGFRTPDIIMSGIEWEMKSPIGNSKNTIKNAIQDGMHQSRNLIIDLRRTPISDSDAIKEIEKQLALSRRLRRIMVISKGQKLLDFAK